MNNPITFPGVIKLELNPVDAQAVLNVLQRHGYSERIATVADTLAALIADAAGFTVRFPLTDRGDSEPINAWCRREYVEAFNRGVDFISEGVVWHYHTGGEVISIRVSTIEPPKELSRFKSDLSSNWIVQAVDALKR